MFMFSLNFLKKTPQILELTLNRVKLFSEYTSSVRIQITQYRHL